MGPEEVGKTFDEIIRVWVKVSGVRVAHVFKLLWMVNQFWRWDSALTNRENKTSHFALQWCCWNCERSLITKKNVQKLINHDPVDRSLRLTQDLTKFESFSLVDDNLLMRIDDIAVQFTVYSPGHTTAAWAPSRDPVTHQAGTQAWALAEST